MSSTANLDMRDAFFDHLYDYVAKDKNVIVMTADHGAFGLKRIENDFPSQYYNVGISEQALIGVAAGLAKSGKKVYVYAINNFVSLRVLEQVNVDVCAMGLDVNIIGVGAGFTYSTDGPTHHGVQDVAATCNLPNLRVYNVADVRSTQLLVDLSYKKSFPKYFRIEKGILPDLYSIEDDISLGCKQLKSSESSLGIISTGYMTHVCVKALNELKKEKDLDISLLDITTLSPLPENEIIRYCDGKNIIVVEENLKSGGIGEKIAAVLKNCDHPERIESINITDDFHFIFGSRESLHLACNIDKDSIKNFILDFATAQLSAQQGQNKMIETINAEMFAEIIGHDPRNLTEKCKSLLAEYNLTFKQLDKREFEDALLCVFHRMQDRIHLRSGKERRDHWNEGWQSNLDSYEKDSDLSSLKPGYFRYEKYLRFNGTYVKPLSDNMIFKFLRILQSQVYISELQNVDNIFELGCGPGHNLAFLSEAFPDKTFVGLDWSSSAIKLVNMLNEKVNDKISGKLFDFFSPFEYDFDVPDKSAFITTGAFEQLGEDHDSLIKFILDKKPDVVVNLEPIHELYDSNNLSDLIALNYHTQRNYLKNYYTNLVALEEKGLVEIKFVKKVKFGSGQFHDGWSILVWRPI